MFAEDFYGKLAGLQKDSSTSASRDRQEFNPRSLIKCTHTGFTFHKVQYGLECVSCTRSKTNH